MGFTKKTLDKMLDEIQQEYFSYDNIKKRDSLWEVIECVKVKYQEEISMLGE